MQTSWPSFVDSQQSEFDYDMFAKWYLVIFFQLDRIHQWFDDRIQFISKDLEGHYSSGQHCLSRAIERVLLSPHLRKQPNQLKSYFLFL